MSAQSTPVPNRHETRRENLRREMAKAQVAALLVTSIPNVTYLTGFSGDSSYLLVTPGGETLLSDPRYTEQIEIECPGLDVAIRASSSVPMKQALADAVRQRNISQLGFESTLTVGTRDDLAHQFAQEKNSPVSLTATNGLVERLRAIKDDAEIAEIRHAVKLAEAAFVSVTALLTRELTERSIAADLEHGIRRLGGVGCSFSPIVAAGPRSSHPHARATASPIGDAPILLIDWGRESGPLHQRPDPHDRADGKARRSSATGLGRGRWGTGRRDCADPPRRGSESRRCRRPQSDYRRRVWRKLRSRSWPRHRDRSP